VKFDGFHAALENAAYRCPRLTSGNQIDKSLLLFWRPTYPRHYAVNFSLSAHALFLKIGGNQIIRAPASANIEFGCSGTNQITVGIKHFQKARLIGAGVWLNSPQCIFAYEE
jgi:hypothetical protein